ncbi:hypothetical protein TNCV_3857251 [Trichonephila clavipes]|nr:hypothetical protein TNCV_3857251 [Trichonephila clavipes]
MHLVTNFGASISASLRRGHYGHPEVSGKIMGTSKIRFRVFVSHTEKHQWPGATVREYYGHSALAGIVIRTPKIRFQILNPHSKMHTGLTFDAPVRAPSVA